MSARLLKNWRDVMARVRGALQRRGRTTHEAEDLVQEAWLRMAHYEEEGQAVDQPEAFLMRTALNLSIDAHRSSLSRGEHVVLEQTVLIDTTPSVEAALLANERMVRLAEGVGRLSDKTREIFLAHRIDGLPYAEIARRHGVSITTVHHHVAKATLKLTSWMEGW